ncbi:MAG: HD domain-containing phosphohydrolase [Armatimonadota bacterium]
MQFEQLPRRLQALILVKAVAAIGVTHWLWSISSFGEWRLLGFLTLCGAIAGACKVDTQVKAGRGSITLGFMVTYFTFLLLGPEATIPIGLATGIAGRVVQYTDGRPHVVWARAVSYHILYNCSNLVLAIAAMGLVYPLLGGRYGEVELTQAAVPSFASALTYYAVNIGGVALAIAWSQNRSAVEVFRKNFSWALPGFLASASLSVAVLWLYGHIHSALICTLVVPMAYVVHRNFRMSRDQLRAERDHMAEVNRLNEAIISSLAMAVDAKDRLTRGHVDRVRTYATRLGEALGISADELQALRIAAILHDIGKIGIPERILCKEGKLTGDEFELMKKHVEIGANILEQVQFPWPVVPIVLGHHERWDGLGYPHGWRGEEIPIGARILMVVDVFDALTSERPYRRAMEHAEALAVLVSNRGSQFDPVVVDRFVELLPSVAEEIQALREDQADAVHLLAPPVPAAVAASAVFTDPEAELLVELTRRALSADGLPAISSLLTETVTCLLPFSTFAVFLRSPDGRHVRAVTSAGLWSSLLDGIEIRMGEGVSGYVTQTRQAVMNGSASLDLARRVRPGENLELNSTLCVPLIAEGEAVGALTVYHTGYNFYQAQHLQRLERIARCAAGALEKSPRALLAERELDHYTAPPMLREAVLRHLDERLHAAAPSQSAVTLALVRLECTANTPALEMARHARELTRLLRLTVRDADFLTRYSSTEFALVLPGCGERESAQIEERLRSRLSRPDTESEALPVPISFGWALFPEDGPDAAALLHIAQSRLEDQSRQQEALRRLIG